MKRKPTLDSLARGKVERERRFSPWKVDSQMASAAGSEQDSKTKLDDRREKLHVEKTPTRNGVAERSLTTGSPPPSCPTRFERADGTG